MTNSLDPNAERESRFAFAQRQSEPLDDDTVELLLLELENTTSKVNRICNTILNRPRGIHEGALDAIGDIKVAISRVRWYMQQKNLEKLALGEIVYNARALASAHAEDNSPLGDCARRLAQILPDAP